MLSDIAPHLAPVRVRHPELVHEPPAVRADAGAPHVHAQLGKVLHHLDQRPWPIRAVDRDDGLVAAVVIHVDVGRGDPELEGLVLEEGPLERR